MLRIRYLATVCVAAMMAGPAMAASYFQYTIFSTHIERRPSGLPNDPPRDFEVRETVTVTVPDRFTSGCCGPLAFAGFQDNLTFQWMNGFDEIFITFNYIDGLKRSEFPTYLPPGSLSLASYRGQHLIVGKYPIFYSSTDAILTSAIRFDSDTAPAFYLDVSRALFPVPEPTSWAMMIGGFGLVGGAMRRGRGATENAAIPATA